MAARRKKRRSDGKPVRRSKRTPLPDPSADELEALEKLTDELPSSLRSFREWGLLSPKRRLRIENALHHRTRSLTVVLFGVHDPHNQAAVMRTCEALGIQELHHVLQEELPFRPSQRVTQNAHRWLDVMEHQDFETAAGRLRSRGFNLLAATPASQSSSLYELDFTTRTALVLGNERDGIPKNVAASCDGSFVIPLYGLSQSLNLSVAAALSLGWAVECRRRAWGEPGDLDAEEKMELRKRFYLKAARDKVPPELRQELVENPDQPE
jgi:tRNA (guanosine-2'-O-)-methyltransferase